MYYNFYLLLGYYKIEYFFISIGNGSKEGYFKEALLKSVPHVRALCLYM